MGLLLRKARRDMLRAKGTFLSLTVMVAVGVMAFTSVYGSYANLEQGVEAAYDELALHDGLVEFNPLPREDVEALAAGTDRFEARLVVELPVTFAGSRTPIVARIISLPDAGEPAVDKLDFKMGSVPRLGEVAAEAGFAAHHDLDVGDQVIIHAPTGNSTLTLSGIAASPEYLWPARNVVEHMPDILRRWGVLFAPQSLVENWTGLAGQANQLVFTTDEAPLDALDSLGARIGPTDVLRLETRDNQASNTQLGRLIGALSAIAFALPLLFLGIVGLSAYVLLSRLVHMQRANIGLLRALGYSPGSVLWHYLSYAPLVAVTGSLVGFGLGFAFSFYITDLFAGFTSLRDIDVTLRPGLLAVGMALSLAFTFLAALLPARRAAKLLPSEAMRPPSPPTGRRPRFENWLPFLRRAPDSLRLGWRNVGRNPRRALLTILGIAMATATVFAPIALLDSLNAAVDDSIDRLQRSDAVVVFAQPVAVSTIDEAATRPGIADLEPILQFPTSLRVGDGITDMTILGLRQDQRALNLYDANNRLREVSPHGILLTRVFEARGVEVGDSIRVLENTTTVLGFVEGFGPLGYVDLGVAQDWLGANGTANQAFASWTTNGEETGRESLQSALPVATVQGVEQARADAEEMLRLLFGFAGFVIAFGIAVGAAVAFNAIAINVLEETTQHATLRTLGFPMRSITAIVATEAFILAVPGVLAGLPLGVWLAGRLVTAIGSDIFVLDLNPATLTYTLATLGGVIPAALAALPTLRAIARMDLGRAARERAR